MKGGKRVQTARPNRINGEIRAQEVRLTSSHVRLCWLHPVHGPPFR
ncbi:hypothetical protein ACUWC4_33315, partial [Klebsiella pneumoniae]